MNYYIQGDAAKAQQIKAAFEKLGYGTRVSGWNFNSDCGVYFTNEADKSVDHTSIETFVNIIKTHPDYKELELPVEPKFKVGDKVLDNMMIVTVREVVYDQNYKEYKYGIGSYWVFESALKPYKPHYDIANFKPFNKVLVKDSCCEKWVASLFSNYDKDSIPHHFVCIDSCYEQCIPFEGNEHLLGTTDPCDERFINW